MTMRPLARRRLRPGVQVWVWCYGDLEPGTVRPRYADLLRGYWPVRIGQRDFNFRRDELFLCREDCANAL